MNSKYMDFVLVGKSESGKTDWYYVNSKHDDYLGSIRWMARWRQYSFFTFTEKVFSSGCLRDIAAFIDELMRERRKL